MKLKKFKPTMEPDDKTGIRQVLKKTEELNNGTSTIRIRDRNACRILQFDAIALPCSNLDIEASPTSTTTTRPWIINNLELTPNKLHSVINLTPF
jgi:hypothetical protein